jgi:hypothetical protein
MEKTTAGAKFASVRIASIENMFYNVRAVFIEFMCDN